MYLILISIQRIMFLFVFNVLLLSSIQLHCQSHKYERLNQVAQTPAVVNKTLNNGRAEIIKRKCQSDGENPFLILNKDDFEKYVLQFNADDEEIHETTIPNSDSWEWMKQNIPFFDSPDEDMVRTYYFRWWTYRKHIKKIQGLHPFYIITEFLAEVPWAGVHNAISCAGAHHIREGRWLHDRTILDDYINFWLDKNNVQVRRAYSFWVADSIYNRALVTGDMKFAVQHLPNLIENFAGIRKTNVETKYEDSGRAGLYFNVDVRG